MGKGTIKLSKEFIEYSLLRPRGQTIYNIQYDPITEIVTLFVDGADLPEKEEGEEIKELIPSEYVFTKMKGE